MPQCIFVIGTRAQVVKISPVLRLAVSQGLDHVVWFTGQHQESIDDLLADFQLTSTFVQRADAKERSSIGKLLVWIPATVFSCRRFVRDAKLAHGTRPLVVVHGDTLSTWLGAIAGRLGEGDVVHLESGLSSGKWSDPFPEELLRRLTFRLSKFALCPNDEAADRMRRYRRCTVVNTRENTLLDCVRFAMQHQSRSHSADADFLVSVHRFQNIYQRDRLQTIVEEVTALASVGKVLFILHPPTELRLKKYGLFDRLLRTRNLELSPRIAYSEFLAIMGRASLVVSDGGSNQEELSYLGVPTVLFRDRSERPDGLGENIVFRHQLGKSLVEAYKDGDIDKLRRDSKIENSVEPSRVTLESLVMWSGEQAK